MSPEIALLMDVLEDELEAKLDEKYCRKCDRVLSRKKDFYKNSKSRDGLQCYCIDCLNEYYENK